MSPLRPARGAELLAPRLDYLSVGVYGAQLALGVQEPVSAACAGLDPVTEACTPAGDYRLFGQFGLGSAALTAYYFAGDQPWRNRRLDVLAPSPGATFADGASQPGAFSILGTYTLGNERTQLGLGYRAAGHTAVNGFVDQRDGRPADLGRDMWTVGVYHDVNSWFRFVAEYHREQRPNAALEAGANGGGPGQSSSNNSFRVGGFIFW